MILYIFFNLLTARNISYINFIKRSTQNYYYHKLNGITKLIDSLSLTINPT